MPGSRSLPLLRLFGIRVGVNYSWFLVLFVVIFVLWDSLSETLDASETTVYVVAVVAAASFFGSIVLHELGHALAARREGIDVEGIDLFLFGGVMKMNRETDTPGAEFRVAAAGPGGDAADHGARLRRRGPAGRRGLVLGRGAALRRGRRDAGRGRRLAARLDEPRAARVQPRARVPARRRPDRPRRRLEADRRPPPGDALRRPHRDRLRLLADAARRAGDRRVGLGRRVRRDLVRRARLAARLGRPRHARPEPVHRADRRASPSPT